MSQNLCFQGEGRIGISAERENAKSDVHLKHKILYRVQFILLHLRRTFNLKWPYEYIQIWNILMKSSWLWIRNPDGVDSQEYQEKNICNCPFKRLLNIQERWVLKKCLNSWNTVLPPAWPVEENRFRKSPLCLWS
jgi:hypothetical protein